MQPLREKTAIVLGASSAYGAVVTRMLANEGAAVVLGGRSRDKLEALEKEIQGSGGRALSLGVHLAKRHHLEHAVEAAVEAYGGPDILVFAARSSAPPLQSPDVDAFERSVDVNVKGFLYALTAALPAMVERGGGSVVYLASEEPEGADPLYRAGRAAARELLEGIQREFASEGIRACEVRLCQPMPEPEQCGRAVRQVLLDAHPGPSEVAVREVR